MAFARLDEVRMLGGVHSEIRQNCHVLPGADRIPDIRGAVAELSESNSAGLPVIIPTLSGRDAELRRSAAQRRLHNP